MNTHDLQCILCTYAAYARTYVTQTYAGVKYQPSQYDEDVGYRDTSSSGILLVVTRQDKQGHDRAEGRVPWPISDPGPGAGSREVFCLSLCVVCTTVMISLVCDVLCFLKVVALVRSASHGSLYLS